VAYPATKNSECKNPLENSPIALIFWDQDDNLPTDYLPKGQTINAEYYPSLLVQLKDILKEKTTGRSPGGFCSFNYNALAHQTLATRKKLAYLGSLF